MQWTVAHQAPLSMEFPRQEYWSGLPFPSPKKPVTSMQLFKVLGCSFPEKVKVKSLSHVQLFATQWTVAHQAPLSMEFSRQEYWSGLPFPTPGDLPEPGIKTASLASPALTGRFFTTMPPGKPKLTVLQFGGFWERIN